MRISGTEPSSVILSQRKKTKIKKLKMYAQKCQNKVKQKQVQGIE